MPVRIKDNPGRSALLNKLGVDVCNLFNEHDVTVSEGLAICIAILFLGVKNMAFEKNKHNIVIASLEQLSELLGQTITARADSHPN